MMNAKLYSEQCGAFRRTAPPRRGVVIMLMVVMLPVLLILASFVINLSYMELVRADMQVTSDAAARAAARTFARTESTQAAMAAANDASARNPVVGRVLPLTNADVVFGASMRPSSSSRYVFSANVTPFNAARVSLNGSARTALPMPFPFMTESVNFIPNQVATATQAELDVSLVVDRSGSMAYASDERADGARNPRNAPPGWAWGRRVPPQSRWNEAQVAVSEFLRILEESIQRENVSLTTYSSGATLDLPLQPNYAAVNNALEGIASGFQPGATNIGGGIMSGVAALTDASRARPWAVRVMVVLTDGIHNTGTDPVAAARTAAREKIVIYTITFSNEADQTRMRTVASIGAGQHYHATTQAALVAAFRTIAQNLPVLLTE
jgi:Ca-activated chloride channel family protein